MSWYGLATFCVVVLLGRGDAGPGRGRGHRAGIGPRRSRRAGFHRGVPGGDLLGSCAAVLGLSALAQTAHAASWLVKYAGALYLLYLAYKLWSAPARPPDGRPTPLPWPTAPRAVSGQLDADLEQSEADAVFSRIAPHGGAARVPERLRTSGDCGGDRRSFCRRHARGLRAARGPRQAMAAQPASDQLMNRGSGTLMAAAAVAVATR